MAVLQHQSQSTGWFAQVQQDLIQLKPYVADTEPLSWVESNDVSQLGQYSFQNPHALTKIGKTVNKLYMGYLRIWRDLRDFQQQFISDLNCFDVQWHQDPLVVAHIGSFACHLCSATFESYKALCSHVFKKHGLANIAHHYADSPTCRGCLKCYNDRDRLVHHLKYFRTGCLLRLVLTVPPLTEATLLEIQEQTQLNRKTFKSKPRKEHHAWPVIQAAGPLRPWPWQRGLCHLQRDARPAMPVSSEEMQQWLAEVLQATFDMQLESVFHALNRQPYHGELAHALYACFDHNSVLFSHSDAADRYLLLQEAIDLWQESSFIPPLQLSPVSCATARMTLRDIRVPASQSAPPSMTVEDRRYHLVEQLWDEYDVVVQIREQLSKEQAKVYAFPQVIPRTMIEYPVYLYVFSGRRRVQDYQFHVESFLAEYACQGQVLCLDLALSPQHDVTNRRLVDDLVKGLTTGHIAAYLVAPPCETWSEARYNIIPDQDCPRPIRTACDPFAIRGLSWKELQQIATANFLLFVAVRLLTISALSGVPGIMEHPKPSRSSERASIWRLPWITKMCEARLLRIHLVMQARYGATALKPTFFATCNIQCFPAIAAKHARAVQWDQLEKLEGKRTDGSWKTASAKEYPGDLNKVLAHCHVLSVL
eukprot:Skav209128  [mRNA]  locus=scaffold682:167178:169124:- [translate_table: standard]